MGVEKKPPHAATVVQRREPHPATVVQRRPPHAATVVQRRGAPGPTPAPPPHSATIVQRAANPLLPQRPSHPAAGAHAVDRGSLRPATVAIQRANTTNASASKTVDVGTIPRPSWTKAQQNELEYEVLTYDKQLVALYDERIRARLETINNRHKLPWDEIRNAAARAADKSNCEILNNIIVLTGAWHRPRLTTFPDWDERAWKAFLSETVNNPLNVYAGDGSVNQSLGSSIDLHSTKDKLGLNVKGRLKVADLSTKKGSKEVDKLSKTPLSPQSKGLVSQLSYLPQLLKGDAVLDPPDLNELYEGSHEHYAELASTATIGHVQSYFEQCALRVKADYEQNWKNQTTEV